MRSTTAPRPPAWEAGPVPSGRPTDATAFRRGTRSTAPALGRPPRWWDYLAGVERVGVELAVAGGALGAAWLAAHGHRPGVVRALVLAAALAALWAGWRATSWALTLGHRRNVVEPLARALSDLVGRHSLEAAGHFLDVPADYAEPGARPVTVRLPLGWRSLDGERLAVEAIVSGRLGVSDPSFSWSTSGRRPHVTVRPRHHPPARLSFADVEVRALVEGRPESAPLIGVAARAELVAVDLDAEAPHMLVSAATGGGKSVLLRAVAAQLLHHGATASILDFKRGSHPWARGIEGVEYLRDVGDMHHALVRLGAEVERRSRLLDDWHGEGEPPFTRHVVIVEESNATLARLGRWWDRHRERSAPKWSPATEALSDVLYMGRALGVNVLLCAQSATARALGGPEVREQFVARCLARYSRQAWSMLCGDVLPMPASTRHPGRVQVVIGGEARATQVLYMTDHEAHAWATSGDRLSLADAFHLGDGPGTVPGRPALRLVEPAPSGDLVTLRQAIEGGALGVSLAVARRARGRDPEFPAPSGRRGMADVWRPAELSRWERNRPRGGPRVAEVES